MRRLRLTAACATALALTLAQTPLVVSVAHATPPSESSESVGAKVAILPLVVEGELPDTDRATLTDQLVGGLQRGAFAVATPDEVEAAGERDCSKPNCIKKIAEKTGATHVVRTVVTVSDRDYTVRVELYDGSDGTTVISSSDGCEICGVADVGGLIETQAATLRTKLDALASGPAAIVVTSDPEGADVTLDGEPFGVTPLDKSIIPGDHTIRVSKEGYITIQEKRTFVEGARETLAYELDKVPNRLPKRPWGWASLGVGIAAIGGGVALTFMHDRPYKLGGKCSGDNIDAQGDCKFLYNTKWEGLAVGLVGGALLTLGIAVLVTTAKGKGKKGEAAMRRMKVSPSGVGIAF
ncbi:PEGA domain-containing protein [Nannocystaceae bacterium ST9]